MQARLIAGLLALAGVTSAAGAAEAPSVLFVASLNHLGGAQMPFLVQPRYQQELEQAGWQVGYCTPPELTWGRLVLQESEICGGEGGDLLMRAIDLHAELRYNHQ